MNKLGEENEQVQPDSTVHQHYIHQKEHTHTEREREPATPWTHNQEGEQQPTPNHQAITAQRKHKEGDRQQVEEQKCEGMRRDSQWMHMCVSCVPFNES